MAYFRDSATGLTSAMFGSQARLGYIGTITGSYNLFLNMESVLKVTNITDGTIDVLIGIRSSGSVGSDLVLTLPPFGSSYNSLSGELYGTAADTYGSISLETTGGIVSEVLRRKQGAGSEFQFVAVTGFN